MNNQLSVALLQGKYMGHDIHVLATGRTSHYVEPSYFNNKIVIGVNDVFMRFPNVDYIVRKETRGAWDAYNSGIPLIVSRHNCGVVDANCTMLVGDNDYYVFEHENNDIYNPNYDVINGVDDDKIVVSYSTITSAMHLAAYMGALNIILVGHDCGSVDGETRIGEIPEPYGGDEFYWRFLGEIEQQTIVVRERLRHAYGCNVYSLNPFINLGLEGHDYEHA